MHASFDFWEASKATCEVLGASLASRRVLAELRDQRLTALLKASRRSALYQGILGARDPASWRLEELPVMDKSYLMANFKDWVCDPRLELPALRQFMAQPNLIGTSFQNEFLAWESSGSHGAPGIFVQDAAAMAIYDALEAARRRVPRPMLRLLDPCGFGERMAFVGATNGHFASTVSVERIRRVNPVLAKTLHSVSFLQPMAKLCRTWNRSNLA